MLAARASVLAAIAFAAAAALLAAAGSTGSPDGATVTIAADLELASSKPQDPILRHAHGEVASASATSAVGRVPNDPLFPGAWALHAINAPLAWQTTTGSADVVVAVLDTGVDGNQPEVADSIVPGVNLVAGSGEPHDDHGHGTLVAGVIGARGDNGAGAAGICWSCSIMPVKVVGADGRGQAATVAAGIRWAVDNGADVINVSLVLGGPDGHVAEAVQYALTSGVVIVSAAGNAAETSPVFPAAEPGVVGVAAVDEADAPYEWTGRGGWVRVAAPGCVPTAAADGSFPTFCGTSAATAVVSGLVAGARPPPPLLTGEEVSRALEATALPLSEVVAAGRVDAAAVLALLAPAA